jgi:glutamate 5-kinase
MAASESSSGMGSGGMASKIEAARIANAAGAALAIVSGLHNHPLARLAQGNCGTVFRANTSKTARKAWLAGRLTAKGRIHIDAGAAKALLGGASLLPAGATHIEGRFARGDVVDICGPDGSPLARGLAEYDAAEALRICGQRSSALPDLLGYAPRAALVHRDHMVLL